MLEELEQLLDSTQAHASRDDYAHAVIGKNCLAKKTASNRKISLQHLRELYALDPRVPLFRILRKLWSLYGDDNGLLALLLALARDPLLRSTATTVLRTPVGHEFARQPIKDALYEVAEDRLNPNILDKTARNAASSWTQSGHLKGRSRKIRQRVRTTPSATAYALVLGYATGHRGALLFDTAWCAVLDASADELINSAIAAKQLGLLDLKQAGSIIDVSFPALLKDTKRGLVHGTY